MDPISLAQVRQQLQGHLDAHWDGLALCPRTCAPQGARLVPMRTGLLLPIPVAIVLGSLCLPQHSDSSFVFVLVVMVFQLITVVEEIEYLAYNVSATCAILRPLGMNGTLSLNVLLFMFCVLGMIAFLGPVLVSPLCVNSCGRMI